jgi:CheY-like chemotaxis protein
LALGNEWSSSDALPETSVSRSAAILLVDDDETVRALCRRGLEAGDARVVEASDGEAALSLIQEWHGQLDLVITDLKMPRLGGRELAEVLSIFRPGLPVLGMTGDPGEPDRRLPTLFKPFAMEDLIGAARLVRSRASEMRTWAEERRARARQARQVAANMMTQHSALRQRVNLVAVALELQQLGNGGAVCGRLQQLP